MLASVMEDVQATVKSRSRSAEPELDLVRDGIVILRGALPPREVWQTAALCEAAFTGLTRESDPSTLDNVVGWGGMSIDQMLACMTDQGPLCGILDRLTALVPGASLIRSLSVLRRRVKHRTSMPWHVDAEAASTRAHDPCVNFWVPFAPVGAGRSPTLEFLLDSAETMRTYRAQRTGETFRLDQWVEMRLGHCRRIIPVLEPGDVMLFDHYTMHRTERVSGRKPMPRITAEIRFQY